MSVAQDSGRSLIAVEYRWVSALAIPILVNLFVIIAVFPGFTGDQATEVGKKIYEVETQLLGALRLAVSGEPLDAESKDVLVKVGVFTSLLVIWCVSSTVITIALFSRLLGPTSRFIAGTIVAYSVLIVLTVKYIFSNQRYAGEPDGYVSVWWSEGTAPLLIAATMTIIAIVQLLLYARLHARGPMPPSTLDYAVPILSICATAVFIGFSLFLAHLAPYLPTMVGATNLLFFFVILLFPFLAGLRWLSLKLPWQATSLIIVAVGVINFLTDHSTSPINAIAKKGRQVSSIRANDINCRLTNGQVANNSFDCWFDHRIDRAEFKNENKPYPIYIIAAAGGGAYAATHTQYFLEYMREHCPIFAHHIFAITGVSGGGLGALAYAGRQAAERPPKSQQAEMRQRCPKDFANWPATARDSAAMKIPTFDYIAPIIAGGLFSELLQRVWPVHVPAFDRTRILQRSLDHQWSATSGKSDEKGCTAEKMFSAGCNTLDYWTGRNDVPALIFNATSVVAGTPVILSHLSTWLKNPMKSNARNSFVVQGKFSLIDAALASASFPIALPAAYVIDENHIPQRVTDGAYFDNSGLPSANSVKDAIEGIVRRSQMIRTLRDSNPGLADLLNQSDADQTTSLYEINQQIQVRVILLDRNDQIVFVPEEQNEKQHDGIFSSQPNEYEYLFHLCKNVGFIDRMVTFRGTEIVAHMQALFSARDQRSDYVRDIFFPRRRGNNDPVPSERPVEREKKLLWSSVEWRSRYSDWAMRSKRVGQLSKAQSAAKFKACSEPNFPIIFNYAEHTRSSLQARLSTEYKNENRSTISTIIQELQPACGSDGCQSAPNISKVQ